MKKMFFTLVVLVVTQMSFAQDAFKADAMKYLELSGQKKTFEMVTKDIVNNVPAEKKAAFQKDLDLSINELMEKLAAIYMTEFTHEDIKAAIKFYESPAGKKISSKSEVLYTKAQTVGQEWGMGLQEKIMKYMQ